MDVIICWIDVHRACWFVSVDFHLLRCYYLLLIRRKCLSGVCVCTSFEFSMYTFLISATLCRPYIPDLCVSTCTNRCTQMCDWKLPEWVVRLYKWVMIICKNKKKSVLSRQSDTCETSEPLKTHTYVHTHLRRDGPSVINRGMLSVMCMNNEGSKVSRGKSLLWQVNL